MAGESKQIYQLTSGTFNGSSLVPFEVPNTDPSSSAEKPYITRKTTGDEVSEFVAKTQEFETDLQTEEKTIIGAINELKEGGGGNADKVELTQAEYDELSEEEKHNGKLYFITDGQAGGGASIDDNIISTDTTWSSEKINDELVERDNSITDRNNALFHSATLENTDLDTLRTSDKFGIYWCSTGNTHIPQPWGILEVFGSGGVINQRFTAHGGQKVWYREFINNAWIDWVLQTNERTDTSVVRYSGVSTSVPLPQVSRSGNVVIVHFVQQYPSGTYSNLFTISPKPSSDQHAYANLAGTNTLIRVNTGGTIAFNNSVTTNGGYLIGQLVYITNE